LHFYPYEDRKLGIILVKSLSMSLKGKAILIIDSDQDMCWLLKKVLTDLGCRVLVSHTWEKTIQYVTDKKIDLVLLDVPLTNFSATKVLQFIKEAQLQAPIIIITPFPSESLRKRMKELKQDNFIDKPFVIDNLITRVKHALQVLQN